MRAYVYTHCTLQGAAILQAVDDSEMHAGIRITVVIHTVVKGSRVRVTGSRVKGSAVVKYFTTEIHAYIVK